MSLLLLLHSFELLVVELLELLGSALIRLDVNEAVNWELFVMWLLIEFAELLVVVAPKLKLLAFWLRKAASSSSSSSSSLNASELELDEVFVVFDLDEQKLRSVCDRWT
jgi:hypothetical protein